MIHLVSSDLPHPVSDIHSSDKYLLPINTYKYLLGTCNSRHPTS